MMRRLTLAWGLVQLLGLAFIGARLWRLCMGPSKRQRRAWRKGYEEAYAESQRSAAWAAEEGPK